METITELKTLLVDEQTLNDLSIFARASKPSVYQMFNKTKTEGGAKLLENYFKNPLSDPFEINRRSEVYKLFSLDDYKFPIDSEAIGTMTYYLENEDVRTQIQVGGQGIGQRFKDMVAADPDFVFVQNGVFATLRVFYYLSKFIEENRQKVQNSSYGNDFFHLENLVNKSNFTEIRQNAKSPTAPRLSNIVLSDLDRLIRFKERDQILEMLDLIYHLDVYISIGQVSRNRGFQFAEALPSFKSILKYEGIFHPFVENAIPNDLSLNENENMLFLTGANMAGKSTLMKSLGIALYLGHMGLPVPAKKLSFSVKDGMFTSINLADNLQQGASHYYTEVLRVKEVAKQLAAGMKLFVIFDEMFRGTNVKDAYDATSAITRAFTKKEGSQFIISTHIMEAGEELSKEDLGIKFQFLPTEMEGSKPVYKRILKNGISADRHGMIIIQNEKVLEILDEGLSTD